MDGKTGAPSCMSLRLLEKITDNFSNDRKVGAGSYGSVYKGEHRNGGMIAVKVLHHNPGLDDELFEREYANIANLQHKNVVKLVGYCNETKREMLQFNGKMVLVEITKRALCFQYMHNGSLDNFISDEFHGHGWRTRYAIIMGICDGLKYLHEMDPPMLHLDLKPANVLLDENMVPKLADFGLSRLFGADQTQKTTSAFGTLGYVPPEYIDAGIISTKYDIFSLGVVIVKIMTGTMVYFGSDEMSTQGFIELVHSNWEKRLEAESLCPQESYSEQVKRCIEVALSCLEANRHKRPSIGEIISKLNETETMIQSPGKDIGSLTHKSELMDIPLNKLISNTLHVADNRGKVLETTFSTNCKPEKDMTIFKESNQPNIKIIHCRDDLGPACSTHIHLTEPWTSILKGICDLCKSMDMHLQKKRKGVDIMFIIMFIIVAGIAVGTAVLLCAVWSPRQVSISVEEASLTRFSLTTTPEAVLAYTLSLTLVVRNPNWVMNITNTVPLEAAYSFLGQQFDHVQVSDKGAKYLHGTTAVHHVVISSDRNYLALHDTDVTEYGKQKANGTFEMELRLTGKVTYTGRWPKCKLEATCPLKLHVAGTAPPDSIVFHKVECKIAKPEKRC